MRTGPSHKDIHTISALFKLAILSCLIVMTNSQAANTQVVGWVENVKVYPGDIVVRAKLDTGAQTSSLYCHCITPEKKDGEQWVSFKITNHEGETVAVRRKVERVAIIKRHFGESQERMVIRLGVCLNNVYKEEEVTLVDRTGFNYGMLLGRNFLAGNFAVNPGATYTTKPNCPNVPQDQ